VGARHLPAEIAGVHHAYEEKLSYVFPAASAGKAAGEMLSMMRERLGNDPERKLRVAGGRAAQDHQAADRAAGNRMTAQCGAHAW